MLLRTVYLHGEHNKNRKDGNGQGHFVLHENGGLKKMELRVHKHDNANEIAILLSQTQRKLIF